MTKDEQRKLRELAESKGIALSGVKNFDGSPSIVSELILTASVLKSKFPAVSDERHKLTLAMEGNMNANDFAITRGRVINFNENAFRDIERLQEEYKKLVNEGWFVKGTDYKAIIHHEFGHVVAETYKIDSLKIACEITGLSVIETLDLVEPQLSLYATSYEDGSEIISEVFADMSTNNPSEFSREFYKRILAITEGDLK